MLLAALSRVSAPEKVFNRLVDKYFIKYLISEMPPGCVNSHKLQDIKYVRFGSKIRANTTCIEAQRS